MRCVLFRPAVSSTRIPRGQRVKGVSLISLKAFSTANVPCCGGYFMHLMSPEVTLQMSRSSRVTPALQLAAFTHPLPRLLPRRTCGEGLPLGVSIRLQGSRYGWGQRISSHSNRSRVKTDSTSASLDGARNPGNVDFWPYKSLFTLLISTVISAHCTHSEACDRKVRSSQMLLRCAVIACDASSACRCPRFAALPG
jgi:hypothetical protein